MKAYLYVLNTLADWEVGYLTAELNSGRFLDKTKALIELIIIGGSTKPIKTMGGFVITPTERIDNIIFKQGDLLVLPGADTWLHEDNKQVLSFIPELLDKNITVAAICGATIALAKNGILNNRQHTSNDKEFLKMTCPEYSGDAYYLNQPAVIDGNLITATGLASLEFSYEVFKKINVMKKDTLEAWYQLYKTKKSIYFYTLVKSLNK